MTRVSAGLALSPAVLCAALLAGCRGAGPTARSGAASRVEPHEVVARVDGRRVLAADLRHQMRRGADRRKALDDLIAFELLAGEALRRGLDRDPSVVRARKRALANLMVRRSFGDHFTKASIPERLLRQAYEANIRRFVHPELVKVVHLVAIARRKRHGAAHHERARKLAARAHSIATAGRLSPDEFAQIADLLHERARADGVLFKSERLTTPRRNYTEASFADAAFALTRPGAISSVVATRYGYHVIYLEQRIAGVDRAFSEVADDLRDRVFDDAREVVFGEYVDKLEKPYQVTLFPEVIARLREPQAAPP